MIQQDEQRAGNLRTLLEQHWLHCRHLESERAWLLNVYGLVMAAVLTYLVTTGATPSPLFHFLLDFLVILAFFGFFLTSRWVYAFERHRETVNILAEVIWRESRVDSALDMTMNIPPIQVLPESIKGRKIPKRLRGFANETFRTRYWFPLFYFIILLGFVVFFCLANYPSLSKGIAIPALAVALLFGLRWYSSLKGMKKKISLK